MLEILKQDDPQIDDWDGLNGSEESLYSLILDLEETPLTMLPVPANWLRPLHQSVTDSDPSKLENADFKVVFMSDCNRLITVDA